ncbi:MAG: GNAT family N-acetyltransferase [Flavobacteriales bacterium]
MSKLQLETPRLFMREFEEADAALIFELDSDPEVHRFLGNKPIKEFTQAEEVIHLIRKQYAERKIGRWAVFLKENEQFIGWAGYKLNTEEINGFINFYDLGYRFQKKFWGQGYASESARHLLDWGLKNLDPERIYAMTHKENEASRRVLIKTGFIERGIFDNEDREASWYDLKK